MNRRLRARIERAAQRSLRRIPDAERALRPLYKAAICRVRRLRQRLRASLQDYDLPDPNRVHWIDPELIRYHTDYARNDGLPIEDRVFDSLRDQGRVYAGDWDLSAHKFSDLLVYSAFCARMKDGIPWQKTPFYQQLLAWIEAGEVLWCCGTKQELDQRFRYLDQLIERIQQQGYHLSEDEVEVNLSRHGEYLFQNGRHRLSIARILGLPKIPVQIFVRHKLWQEFRESLTSIAKRSAGEGLLSQPLIHPDLDDMPVAAGCEERWAAIQRCLQPSLAVVLDVGAQFGFYCHKLEDLGFDCYAVEDDGDIASAAEVIRVSQGKKFSIMVGDIMQPAMAERMRNIRPEVVLGLSGWNRFLKTEARLSTFRKWLKSR